VVLPVNGEVRGGSRNLTIVARKRGNIFFWRGVLLEKGEGGVGGICGVGGVGDGGGFWKVGLTFPSSPKENWKRKKESILPAYLVEKIRLP